VTYEAGIQVHSNAIKANFDTVVESRVKISFEIPYPEMIIKSVENSTTAARGGAKWAPLFSSVEGFEDDFRDGAHRRVMRGIDNAYELTQKSIDSDYPIGYSGPKTTDVRKVHAILSDQLRRAYRQTVAFVDCLLPFYRTLKGGSLSKEEAWDRVFIFVLEVLTSVQEERVMSLDIASESSMIWGAFKATDFTEDFRNKKFVKHHTALAILALTSIEREGKTMALLEEKIEKKLAESSKTDKVVDKITKLDTRVQTLENKIKNMVAKNPDLK
jgi:hypothetical protein